MAQASTALPSLPAAWRQQAPWLARLWRLSPLTLLVHDSSSDAGRLLTEDVLPLTARRTADQMPATVAPPAVTASGRLAEKVLRFDGCGAADPGLRLRRQLWALQPGMQRARQAAPATLAETARRLQAAGGARLMLVLEDFETLLLPRNDCPSGRQAFIDGLIELLDAPGSLAHVLIVVDARADTLLQSLRRRVAHFDDHRLRLGVLGEASPSDGPAPAPASAAAFQRSLDAMLLRVASLAASPATDAVQAGDPSAGPLPSMVERARPLARMRSAFTAAVATGVQPVAFALPPLADGAGPVSAPEDDSPVSGLQRAAVPVADLPSPADGQAEPVLAKTERNRRRAMPAWVALAMVAGVVGAVIVWQGPGGESGTGIAALPPKTATATSVIKTAAAPFSPTTAGLEPAEELAQTLAAAGLGLDNHTGDAPWSPTAQGRPAQPALALLRYDALQARVAASRGAGLQLLAPAYTEPLWFAVRTDSPLRHLQDMAGARVDAGPAGSARALTIGRAWSALFATPWRSAPPEAAGLQASWNALAQGRVDVVAWVGEGAAASMAGLSPQQRSGLRLLTLDRRHPGTARLLQGLLPVTLAADEAAPGLPARPQQGLAAVAFLVAARPLDSQQRRSAVDALCSALPGLRAQGHRAWRSLRQEQQLPGGWPYAAEAQRLAACPALQAETVAVAAVSSLSGAGRQPPMPSTLPTRSSP